MSNDSVSKESADKMFELKNELRNRMDAINQSNAVIEFDLDGNIKFANELFLKTMGYDNENMKILQGNIIAYLSRMALKTLKNTQNFGKFLEVENSLAAKLSERKKMDL